MAARVTLTGDLTKRMVRGERRAAKAVEATLKDMQSTAQQRSRVDTGEMRAGWEIVKLDEHRGVLRNGVNHVKFNEYGTRHMSAQPMLHPAVESARQPFARRVRKAYER